MTVRQWYRVAPDLKAARGHAVGRHVPPLPVVFTHYWEVYVERDYGNVSARKKAAWSRKARNAWKRRKARDAEDTGFGVEEFGVGELLAGAADLFESGIELWDDE